VAAVALAVSAVIANWEGIKEGLDVIWDGIKIAASAVVSFLAGIWDGIVAVFRAGWDFVAGIIDQIASAVGGLFGGIGDLMIGNFGGIPGRAEGGPVAANRPYIVGERGPELFVPNSSGSIVPNGAATGGTSITINMGGVSVRNDNDIRRLSEELARSMGRELRGLGAMA
jgi:phage-related minor tail protein